MKEFICDKCGKTFLRYSAQVRGERKFCSVDCQRSSGLGQFAKGFTPWNKGAKYDDEMKSRINTSGLTLGHQVGSDHHLWKESGYGYHAVHHWIARRLGKPSKCELCGTESAKRFEWANISGEYKRELDDWKRLCKSCHNRFDHERKTHGQAIKVGSG